MNPKKTTARIAGALFLLAMVTSLVGGAWLESILTAPDYLATVSGSEAQVLLGVASLFTWNMLQAFGLSISAGLVVALQMILTEIFLGIWLLAKGFSPAASAAG